MKESQPVNSSRFDFDYDCEYLWRVWALALDWHRVTFFCRKFMTVRSDALATATATTVEANGIAGNCGENLETVETVENAHRV